MTNHPNPNSAAQAAVQDQIAALQDLRHGVEMNRAYLDDGDIKLAALDTTIGSRRPGKRPYSTPSVPDRRVPSREG